MLSPAGTPFSVNLPVESLVVVVMGLPETLPHVSHDTPSVNGVSAEFGMNAMTL